MKNSTHISNCTSNNTAGLTAAPLTMCLPVRYIIADWQVISFDVPGTSQTDADGLTNPEYPP
jgi:hypothetical protein